MRSKNGRLLLLLLVAGALLLQGSGLLPVAWLDDLLGTSPDTTATSSGGTAAIAAAYRAQRSDLQVSGEGVVLRVLQDDLEGSRHQRFVLRLDNGLTLLVAHNIDLAPRVPGLRPGDVVAFSGEYEWNHQGGVLHWTHHDPAGHHADGWLRHRGRTYR